MSNRFFLRSLLFLGTILVLIFSGCSTPLSENIQPPIPTNLTTGEGIQKPIPTLAIKTPTPSTPSPATATLPGLTKTPVYIHTPTIVTATSSTDNTFEIVMPAWFIFTDEKTHPSDEVIYLRTDGIKIHKSSGISTYPTKYIFPRDGQMMAFVNYPQDSDNDIVLTRPDFSSLKRYAKTPDWLAFGSWSPDGNTIVFTQTTETEDETKVDLYILDIHTGVIRQLTDTPEFAEHAAVFSPEGTKIALNEITMNIPTNQSHLVILETGGNNRRNVMTETKNLSGISWSPDGKKLVFGSGEECTDLFVINEDGSGLEQLTNMPGNEERPVWSPDGKWISFIASKECGINARGWRIYTVTPEGNGLAEIKNSYNKLPFRPAVFPLPALQAGKSFTITESGDGLNLRQSSSLSAEVIIKLKEGDEIQVLEGPVEAEEYLWWYVRLEGSDDEGWVAEIPGWFNGEW